MLISSTLSFIQSVPVRVHNIVRLSERCLHASLRVPRKISDMIVVQGRVNHQYLLISENVCFIPNVRIWY